jgi:hypothetical protein
MASVSERDCIVCGLALEPWMPGALCGECAAFAPRSADSLLWNGGGIVARPLGRGTRSTWRRETAALLGMPAGAHVEGHTFGGDMLPKQWHGYLYRWVGVGVQPSDEPAWPELRVGSLCYQQWERTVIFPDGRLWITARWHPDRGKWTELPDVTTSRDWEALWKKGMVALNDISNRGPTKYVSRTCPPERFSELLHEAVESISGRTPGDRPTHEAVIDEIKRLHGRDFDRRTYFRYWSTHRALGYPDPFAKY